MKLPTTKLTITTTALVVATAFTAGYLMTQQPKTQHLDLAADTSSTPSQASTTDDTSASTTTADTSTTSTDQPSTGSSTSSDTQASTISTPTSDQAAATNTTTTTETTDQTPPFTVVSAVSLGWTTPTVSPNNPYELQSFEVCAYNYSDGSTKQMRIAEHDTFTNDSHVTVTAGAAGDCTVASAPAS